MITLANRSDFHDCLFGFMFVRSCCKPWCWNPDLLLRSDFFVWLKDLFFFKCGRYQITVWICHSLNRPEGSKEQKTPHTARCRREGLMEVCVGSLISGWPAGAMGEDSSAPTALLWGFSAEQRGCGGRARSGGLGDGSGFVQSGRRSKATLCYITTVNYDSHCPSTEHLHRSCAPYLYSECLLPVQNCDEYEGHMAQNETCVWIRTTMIVAQSRIENMWFHVICAIHTVIMKPYLRHVWATFACIVKEAYKNHTDTHVH
jgi:hypothetical protein